MDAKPCEAVAEHEIKEQQGGPPVKGNWRTSIYLGMEMIKHVTTAKQNIIKENKRDKQSDENDVVRKLRK